jgi:hypothetical protein
MGFISIPPVRKSIIPPPGKNDNGFFGKSLAFSPVVCYDELND